MTHRELLLMIINPLKSISQKILPDVDIFLYVVDLKGKMMQ